MPVADMLVDGAAHNQMLSFMDGNAGYNQIMVAEEDIHKTAFISVPTEEGQTTGSPLVQDNKERKGQAVYYLSRTLTEVERKYSAIERPCLALYFTAIKLRHYMVPFTIYIIARTVLIKDMLTRPMLRGRTSKWTLALSEFAFRSVPQKSIKEQAVADFLLDHPGEEIENMDSMDIANADLLTRAHTCLNNPSYSVHLTPWKLYFDGSKTDLASGARIVLEDPLGIRHCYSFQLDFQCTNNMAEYEALIIGLEMLVELGVQCVEILGDSMLVLKQIAGEYKCLSPSLAVYLVALRNLLAKFREATWEHIPREKNLVENEMAQIAIGVQMPQDCVQRIIKVGRKSLASVLTRGMEVDVNYAMMSEEDWRLPLINYLQYPALPSVKRIRIMALNYVMWNEELVRKTKDELLLRCLGKEEYMKVMGEVHEGICGAYQGGREMCWLIRK
ncbi:hypothetical protein L3X38_025447 [Prunus dulcis]|uniref:RNase H type-1 domain-containing protein n=1 Tax=Prunus dulcis TaxID=3755 RepID=A0AAD4W3D3_PRUDU|nr:hypothetical protein L3X38_025447 [Prunus dulcis]